MQSTHEYKSEPTPFDRICEAAREGRVDKLDAALQLACIDVWNEYVNGTPVTLLAMQGDAAAVDFLISHGASRGYAACGYAQSADHTEKVYELWEDIKKYHPLDLQFFLKQMLYGFALVGKADAAWEKVKHDHPDKIQRLLSTMSLGLAQHGELDKAKQILMHAKERYPEIVLEISQSIVTGLVLYEKNTGGDMTLSVEFLNEMTTDPSTNVSINSTVRKMLRALTRDGIQPIEKARASI